MDHTNESNASHSEDMHLALPGPKHESKHRVQKLDPRLQTSKVADAPTATVINREKTSRDVEVIAHALSKHFIFTNLSTDSRIQVINNMRLYIMGPKEVVFQQGTVGQNFYIVAHGKLEVLVNGKRVNILGAGDSFGELALIHDALRSASIVTVNKVCMWVLDRNTFRTAIQELNVQNYKEHKDFLQTVPILSILTPEQMDCLLESVSSFSFKKRQVIVREGDPGNSFYLIKKGKVTINMKGEIVGELQEGQFFGERALLYNTPHRSTAIAMTDVKCIVISRKSVNSALGCKLQQVIYENSTKIAISKSKILSQLDRNQQAKISECLHIKVYENGETVIHQGEDKSNKLWMVIQGNLKVGDSIVGHTYECIGDYEMSEGLHSVFSQKAVAEGECHIGELTKKEIEDCLGIPMLGILEFNIIIKAVKHVPIFSTLSNEKVYSIASKVSLRNYDDQEVIFEQNTPGDLFFLIKYGKVQIVKDGVVLRIENKTDYFGERSLLFDETRTASVIAAGEVSCWVLKREDFLQILDPAMLKRLVGRINLQDATINLENLRVIKALGKGMFGKVFLVFDNKKQRLFALKTVDKKRIDAFGIHENLMLERKILLSLDHQMVLKLVKTFKDPERIYFLTEYVKGQDMFDVMRIYKNFSEIDVKFYISCLCLVLEYLHQREIIYRDLKPENVVIDMEGYTKLVDFGTCKFLTERTYTIIGTPHYMAPEIILGHGYSHSADYWSLGVIMYELLYGGVPFGDHEDDPSKVYEAILSRKLVFSSKRIVSDACKSLVEQLLNRKSVLRNGGSIENLKMNEWLRGTNWESYLNKEVEPPYVPQLPDIQEEIQQGFKRNETLDEFIRRNPDDDDGFIQPDEVVDKPGWDAEF